ncbi:CCA tRNA nucleotidyltransferase [Paenibacillus sp. NPDC058071]|uniref:CCA tRNA nucleotidyltransferase n=1 Tax=Paenibacillus sp. NPDC058071 TaxID=3346326 RepID=UPI0036D99A74
MESPIKIPLPEPIQRGMPVVAKLEEHGYEAVFVGGCVRDAVMGLPIKDIDIATSARPEQVMELFPRCVPTGLQHGTVTVLDGLESYEITTYRTESAYENHRRPSEVRFIQQLEADLERRDLTINAMAIRSDGTLVDPFGGSEDIVSGIIRAVGDADLRFTEDALRMLRAIRFSARFGFAIESGTWEAVERRKPLLASIAMERVQAELLQMLDNGNTAQALELLAKSGLLAHAAQTLPAFDVWFDSGADSCRRFVYLDNIEGALGRLAGLMTEDAVMQDMARTTLLSLKLSNEQSRQVLNIVQLQQRVLAFAEGNGNSLDHEEASLSEGTSPATDSENWTKAVLAAGKEAAALWLNIVSERKDRRWAPQTIKHWQERLRTMPAFTLKELNLNGRQLAEVLERKPGPWTGDALSRLLLEVAEGRLPNESDALLTQAKRWMDGGNLDE